MGLKKENRLGLGRGGILREIVMKYGSKECYVIPNMSQITYIGGRSLY